jgi:hypothetical protein
MKMRQKSQTRQTGAAKVVKDIRRATRKQYSFVVQAVLSQTGQGR